MEVEEMKPIFEHDDDHHNPPSNKQQTRCANLNLYIFVCIIGSGLFLMGVIYCAASYLEAVNTQYNPAVCEYMGYKVIPVQTKAYHTPNGVNYITYIEILAGTNTVFMFGEISDKQAAEYIVSQYNKLPIGKKFGCYTQRNGYTVFSLPNSEGLEITGFVLFIIFLAFVVSLIILTIMKICRVCSGVSHTCA